MRKVEHTSATEIRPGQRWKLPGRVGGAVENYQWQAFARRPDLLPGVSLAGRPGLLVLTTLLLIGLCAGLACWRPRAHPAKNDLLVEESSLKLNEIRGETPAVATSKADAGAVAFDLPGMPPSTPAPSPMTVANAGPDLTTSSPTLSTHQGDDPMLTKKNLLPAVAASALLASSAFAQGTDTPALKPDLATISKQMGEIQKKLDQLGDVKLLDIQKQLDDFKKPIASIKGLQDSLTAMDKQVSADLKQIREDNVTTNLKIAKSQDDIADLHRLIDQIQKDLDALKTRTPTSQISGYPPVTPAPLPTGRIHLANTYFQPMTIVVNRTAYELLPGGSRDIPGMPAGAFTYEVLGVTPQPLSRTLAANETFTITVHPQ